MRPKLSMPKDANPVTDAGGARQSPVSRIRCQGCARWPGRSRAFGFAVWRLACGNCLGRSNSCITSLSFLGGSFDLPHAETHAVILRTPRHTTRKRLPTPSIAWPVYSAESAAGGCSISPPSLGDRPSCEIWV